jgi:hypothetical protein
MGWRNVDKELSICLACIAPLQSVVYGLPGNIVGGVKIERIMSDRSGDISTLGTL